MLVRVVEMRLMECCWLSPAMRGARRINFKWCAHWPCLDVLCWGVLLDLLPCLLSDFFVSNSQMESVDRIGLEMHRAFKLKKRKFCEAEQTEMQKFSDTTQ